MPTNLQNRYRGCLLALACGDALGGPVEFIARSQIAHAYPDGVRDFLGGGWLKLRPGEITDDTQMTLALARSLAQTGDLDMADVTHHFLIWYASDPKDIGNTTRAALRYLKTGVPWQEAGERIVRDNAPGRSAGNGSVMRSAPVALRYRRDPAALRQASLDTARITHADPRCTWAAVAVNQAIAHLLDGNPLSTVLAAAARDIDNADVRSCVHGAANRSIGEVRAGGFVLDTLGAALWCLLNHASLEEAVVAAANLGDDADTTAAVAGALAGAHHGDGAIPDRWLSLLEPRQELTDLADRLRSLSR